MNLELNSKEKEKLEKLANRMSSPSPLPLTPPHSPHPSAAQGVIVTNADEQEHSNEGDKRPRKSTPKKYKGRKRTAEVEGGEGVTPEADPASLPRGVRADPATDTATDPGNPNPHPGENVATAPSETDVDGHVAGQKHPRHQAAATPGANQQNGSMGGPAPIQPALSPRSSPGLASGKATLLSYLVPLPAPASPAPLEPRAWAFPGNRARPHPPAPLVPPSMPVVAPPPTAPPGPAPGPPLSPQSQPPRQQQQQQQDGHQAATGDTPAPGGDPDARHGHGLGLSLGRRPRSRSPTPRMALEFTGATGPLAIPPLPVLPPQDPNPNPPAPSGPLHHPASPPPHVPMVSALMSTMAMLRPRSPSQMPPPQRPALLPLLLLPHPRQRPVRPRRRPRMRPGPLARIEAQLKEQQDRAARLQMQLDAANARAEAETAAREREAAASGETLERAIRELHETRNMSAEAAKQASLALQEALRAQAVNEQRMARDNAWKEGERIGTISMQRTATRTSFGA
ncbi:hypothetical protein PAPYR_9611 [Paratrimastix pyriformis]|uniref:Uncharacterized protein n=1 Tax=Paratrimastix pyriformis TaxID=342808 RepID=A0ABQ8UBN7_9EUKA|nr:hypothetical protein PAPYR_9611 [Paratrimastix pyriformis]